MTYSNYALLCGGPKLDESALARRARARHQPEVHIEQQLPADLPAVTCRARLKKLRVAVVGGGLAGLMAARTLGEQGVQVTLFEARPRLGGRVLSNRTFSEGRVIEEGAELIGSFHTKWLELARVYGLAMISRMDDSLYEREGLDIRLTLDKRLTMPELHAVAKQLEERVLRPLAVLAKIHVKHPAEPWLDVATLKAFDMTVADALIKLLKVNPTSDRRLWMAAEFLIVNDEVAPLEEMSLIGLLCKVRAAQSASFNDDDAAGEAQLMRYFTELEIFRCAEGCDELAARIAKDCQARLGLELKRETVVTQIDLATGAAKVTFRRVPGATGPVATIPATLEFDFVVLAIPPTVWKGVKVTSQGKPADPEAAIGKLQMGPCVKFFSKLKERFWIKESTAPSGGASDLGQVWEGTDNQTRIKTQGIVLSVFAGPIRAAAGGKRRSPIQLEFEAGLKKLFPVSYESNLLGGRDRLLSDWPSVPFIMTGYASPAVGQVLSMGKRLTEPFHDRLFFAGEHTQMAFFGYMEGALRSGERAARTLMTAACSSLKRTALVAEAESPFLSEQVLGAPPERDWEARAARAALESPFAPD